MKKIIYIYFLLIFISGNVLAQVPQIINIEKQNTWPGDSLVIVGNNFSTNIADLEVWFGPVKGSIINATNTVIGVIAPPQAHYEPITVLKKSNGTIGYSSKKFYISYNGETTFDETKFAAPVVLDAKANLGEKEFYDICTCDLNGDKKPDIVATKFEGATDLAVLINTSTIANISYILLDKTNTPSLVVGTPTLNVTCSDVNSDGKPDIVVSRNGVTRNEAYLLINTSAGGTIAFAPKRTLVLPTGVKSRGVSVVDLDTDGKPEILVADGSSGNIYIFKNNSTTSNVNIAATPVAVNIPGPSGFSKIDFMDMNGDNVQDLILSPYIDANLYVLINNSNTSNFSFEIKETNTGAKTFIRIQAGDLNNDGLPDVVGTNTINSEIILFKNTGEANFAAPIIISGGASTWGIDLADMNGDGLIDIIIGNNNSPTLNFLLNNSTSTTLSFDKRTLTTDLSSRNIYAGDFNGDAKPDIIFTATGGGSGAPHKIEILKNLNCYVPDIRNTEPFTICPGQTKQIQAIPNPAAIYNWYQLPGATPVKSGSENYLDITYNSTPTTYKVEAITEGGNCITTSEIIVEDGTGTIPGNPTPSVSNNPVCEGETIELSVQALTDALYSWTGPNGFTSSEREPVIPDATTEMAGVYNVSIKIGQCLSSEESLIVEVATLPAFNLSAQNNTVFCQGNTNTLSVTTRSGFTYAWQKDGAPLSTPNTTTTSYAANASGVYSVLITNNTTGCSLVTNTVELTVVTPPVAAFDLSTANACAGDEVILTNNSVADPNATPVYNWNFGNGTTSSSVSPTVTYSSAANYTVTLNLSYENVTGCTNSLQKVVVINDPVVPEITATAPEICPEENITLSISGTYSDITWSTGESSNSINVNMPAVYSVTTIDNNGCTSNDSFEVLLKDVPTVVATANTASTQPVMDTIFINSGVVVSLNATGADSYSWSPMEPLDDASIYNPQATVAQSTMFYVTGSLIGGCTGLDSIYIKVNAGEGLPITVRKVFSPESTINPTWDINYTALNETCHFAMFDERGVKILEEILDDSNKIYEWDGTSEGNPVPEGVYYYVIGCPNGGKKAGTVLVVRK